MDRKYFESNGPQAAAIGTIWLGKRKLKGHQGIVPISSQPCQLFASGALEHRVPSALPRLTCSVITFQGIIVFTFEQLSRYKNFPAPFIVPPLRHFQKSILLLQGELCNHAFHRVLYFHHIHVSIPHALMT